jgi:hypothetical protein
MVKRTGMSPFPGHKSVGVAPIPAIRRDERNRGVPQDGGHSPMLA